VPPTELVIIKAYDDTATALSRETGVPVISGPDLRWGRCDVKSTNLLGNVLALEHAKRAGAHEAILVGRDGLVTEATHSSVLWVRNGRLEGTPDGPEILPGTKRHFVQSLAPDARVAFAEARVTLDELKAADEVMLLGTTIEVLPVISIDGDRVGDGTPGPVARRLQTAYWAAVERWLSEVGP
jgi:D-alanine transaminase